MVRYQKYFNRNQTSNLFTCCWRSLVVVTGQSPVLSPLYPSVALLCTQVPWSPCWRGWHIYSCFRLTGRQSDMSYCLWDASCLSSIPDTRRRQLHNWRTGNPRQAVAELWSWWICEHGCQYRSHLNLSLIWTFSPGIPPDNGSLRDPCEVCRTVVETQFQELQSTMKWTSRIITCSWKDSWWISDGSSG